MPTLIHDVEPNLTDRGEDISSAHIQNVSAVEVLYADDTILITQSQRMIQEYLHDTETVSARYGLHLNADKCELRT
eukprot:6023547-Prorocentrum_lima.AAC.1